MLRPAGDFSPVAEPLVARLRAKLGDLVPYGIVEHVGGTSLADGITKGDVDVNLRVPPERMAEAVSCVESCFPAAQRENWTPTFASFSDPSHELPVGIQVTALGGPEDKMVALRELFLRRPELLEEYAACKRRAAASGPEGYWEAKNELLQRIIRDHIGPTRDAQ